MKRIRKNSLYILLLLVLFFALLFNRCSFNSTFFPIDSDWNGLKDIDYEEIILASKDEHKIYYLLLNTPEESIATIFLLHGSGANLSNWIEFCQPLIRGGLRVFMMEYRGFSKSTGKSTHMNVLGDAINGINYLLHRFKENSSTKILLMGQSYGGQIAIRLASGYAGKINGLILEGTFTTFARIAVFSTPLLLKPFTGIILLNPYKVVKQIKKVTVPVMIIPSRNDQRVPLKMGERLYQKANNPKELWIIDGKHIHGLLDYSDDYVHHIKGFFNLH